jgi:hypothetical protein
VIPSLLTSEKASIKKLALLLRRQGMVMLIDIYSSNKRFGKHLSVPAGSEDPKSLARMDPDFGSMTLVSAKVPIAAGTLHPALDVADVIAQIRQKGYVFHSYRRARYFPDRRSRCRIA